GGVVELQIAAAGVVERADRLPVGLRQIIEDRIALGVELLVDGAWFQAEMQDGRTGDRHLRNDARVRLQELEVLQERVIGEAELAHHSNALRLGLDALELDAVIELVELDAVEQTVEIEMPPRPAELAVGRLLHPDVFLLLDQLLDLAILDLPEFVGADLAL